MKEIKESGFRNGRIYVEYADGSSLSVTPLAVAQWDERLDAQAARIAELEKALEKIANDDWPALEEQADEMKAIARAALEAK